MTIPLPKRDYKIARIRRAGKGPESAIQAACEEYARLRGVEAFHMPAILLNAAFRRHTAYGGEIWALREAAHSVAGMPDLTLFYKGNYRMVEIKTPEGKLTHNQSSWLKRHNGVCLRSVDAFKEYLDGFIKEVDDMSGAPGEEG